MAKKGDSPERVVVVTGAGTGIGRAIASRTLRDGYRCVLAGPYQGELEETIVLSGVDAGRALTMECDVRDAGDRSRLVAVATGAGALYGLVNNAGITRLAPLLDESVHEWRETIETNLEAAYFMAQGVLPHMRDRREGRIINIASIYGIVARDARVWGVATPTVRDGRGPIRESAYAASKGGLLQLTRDLAAAVGSWGITVNAVSPGVVEHPSAEAERRAADPERPALTGRVDAAARKAAQEAAPQIRAQLISRVPLERLARVEDIAGPVSFLLSSDASYVTGTNLVADGGWSIW